jgi:hypothetical protein
MPSEVRFFRGDRHVVNGLEGYKLGKEPSETTDSLGISVYLDETYADQYLAMEVYRRGADGKEELLSGGLVAEARGNTSGLLTTTWKTGKVNLAPSDAIVVRVYGGDASPPSKLLGTFITEPLVAAKSLDEAEWTINYLLERKYEIVDSTPITTYSLIIGSASFIENFTWTPYILMAELMSQAVQLITVTVVTILITTLLKRVFRTIKL